jgi:hypothetical protein
LRPAPFILLALALLAALWAAPAGATNRDDSRTAAGDQSMEPLAVNTIRLASEAAGHVSVNRVVLMGPSGARAAATEGAVTRELVRSRLPTLLPLVGGLFEKPPVLRVYSDANRVGEALLLGRTLVVRLTAPLSPAAVFIANGQHTFGMAGAGFREAAAPDLTGAVLAGRAHAEGAELVVLVTPSILE